MANQYSNPIPPKAINRIGQIYGHLTVIGFSRADGNHTYWYCRCKCGAIKEIVSSSLNRIPKGYCSCRHFLPDGQQARYCHGCERVKSLSEFWAKGKNTSSRCKECEGERRRSEYAQDGEHIRAINRAWRERTPGWKQRKTDYDRKRYESDPEKAIEQTRIWREANVDRVKESRHRHYQDNKEVYANRSRKWKESNPGKMNEYSRNWYRRNKEKARAWLNKIRAQRAGAPGSYSVKDVRSIYKSQNGLCVYHTFNPRCHSSLENGYHIDHTVPLARGGSNWPDNLQLLCAHCNLSKGAKTHDEFLIYLKR